MKDLTSIKGVGDSFAKKLRQGGYKSVTHIVNANAKNLQADTNIPLPIATRIIKEAQILNTHKGSKKYVVGVDMGGTKILAATITEDGTILSRAKTATKAHKNPTKVIDRIADCINKAIEQASLSKNNIQSIGIGAPGPLNPQDGVIIFAPNLNWYNVPLKKELEDRLEIPTFLDNDVNVGTMGEFKHGAGQGVNSLVGIFVGTGIGGGIILNGELFHGANKTAGEIGHIIVKADGPKCNCGNSGCLEAISSRTAITKQIRKAVLTQGKKSHILELNDGNLNSIRSGTLAKAIAKNDKVTIKVMQRAAKYLGIGIASVVNFLNPEMIILGGGVVEALDDKFIERIRKFAAEYALPNTMDGVEIVTAKLGDDAGVIGASVLAHHNFDNNLLS